MSHGHKITRKLKAILSADVKGYSLLMSDDEVLTLKTLDEYKGIMSELIQSHSGRVVDSVGDNVLAEFSSAVDAVNCSIEIQKKLKKENSKYAEHRKLQFRIGINIGDVIHDGGRIVGEGVNIASRIEGIADAGGISISRSTYDQIKGKLDIQTKYLGEHQVKNIQEPVRVYKVLLDSDSYEPLVKEKLELPDKPSIAVLPFTNMSGDPDQEYFSDGLTEQIINGLCKVKDLFVIARNSSFAYKGKAVGIKQIAHELGVEYIIEGSVQRAGNRVRITAQLIKAETDFHMWSENYDRELSDIFALQDEITLKLISVMALKLIHGKESIFSEGHFNKISSYEYFMRGLDKFNHFNKYDNLQARRYFEQASVSDKPSALILSWIGMTHAIDYTFNWSSSPKASLSNLDYFVNKAMNLNAALDLPHAVMGLNYLYKANYEKAIEEASIAIELNPNSSDAMSFYAFALAVSDRAEESIIYSKKSIRLNPIPSSRSYMLLGVTYTIVGDFDKGIEILGHSIKLDPNNSVAYPPLIACYIVMNNNRKVKELVKKLLEIDPSFRTKIMLERYPMKNRELMELYISNLRKAGLPD